MEMFQIVMWIGLGLVVLGALEKKWTWIPAGCIILFGNGYTMINRSRGYLLVFIGVVLVPVCAIIKKLIRNKKAKIIEAERVKLEKEKQVEQEKEWAIAIYKKCREKK